MNNRLYCERSHENVCSLVGGVNLPTGWWVEQPGRKPQRESWRYWHDSRSVSNVFLFLPCYFTPIPTHGSWQRGVIELLKEWISVPSSHMSFIRCFIKVTLVTEKTPPCIHMPLSQNSGIEYFVDNIVIIYIEYVQETCTELEPHLFLALQTCPFHLSMLQFRFLKTVGIHSALSIQVIIVQRRIYGKLLCDTWFLFMWGKNEVALLYIYLKCSGYLLHDETPRRRINIRIRNIRKFQIMQFQIFY
jgi:hypothetical protein